MYSFASIHKSLLNHINQRAHSVELKFSLFSTNCLMLLVSKERPNITKSCLRSMISRNQLCFDIYHFLSLKYSNFYCNVLKTTFFSPPHIFFLHIYIAIHLDIEFLKILSQINITTFGHIFDEMCCLTGLHCQCEFLDKQILEIMKD